MRAITTLWMITAVSALVSRLISYSAGSTQMPVFQSRAPVGSSHSSTAGCLAIARAIATPLLLAAGYLRKEVVHAVLQAHRAKEHRLAAARGTQQHDELAGKELHLYPAQRMHLDLSHPIDLGQTSGAEDGIARAVAVVLAFGKRSI